VPKTSKVKMKVSEMRAVGAILLLTIVPLVAGVFRLNQLLSGEAATAENTRFLSAPLPIFFHISTSLVYCFLGAFQFVDSLRLRWPRWHRIAGRILAIIGLGSALSGLWMTQFYPNPPGDGQALYIMRLVVGVLMTISIIYGVRAIASKNVVSHKAWMIRAYALGMGAGTQVLTHLPWVIFIADKPGETPRAIMMGAGWLINMCIAEYIIRRRQKKLQLH
jgi:uncharacterized membrane protein